MNSFSHFNQNGEASMVDVSEKLITERTALASCWIRMKRETFQLLKSGAVKKGDAFTIAKIAGIQAAKRTAELIPLCHPLALDSIKISIFDRKEEDGFMIEAQVKSGSKTGVEMEALTAASFAALGLYDMAKSHDLSMAIEDLHLIYKKGGKSEFQGRSADGQ